jgi:uncharacterized membrane protein
LVPALVFLLGIEFLGEELACGKLVGIVFILSGIILIVKL